MLLFSFGSRKYIVQKQNELSQKNLKPKLLVVLPSFKKVFLRIIFSSQFHPQQKSPEFYVGLN